MSVTERQIHLQKITKRLVLFTSILLFIPLIGLYCYIDRAAEAQKSYLVLLVFFFGLIGGFVSMQQRLPKTPLNELKQLSSSWVSITLVPINGGIFAIVLMLMFAGKIIQGQLFPIYPDADTFPITSVETLYKWIKNAYPATGVDTAKLLFWSFVAGFSERFVPQIIQRTTEKTNDKKDSNNMIVDIPPAQETSVEDVQKQKNSEKNMNAPNSKDIPAR